MRYIIIFMILVGFKDGVLLSSSDQSPLRTSSVPSIESSVFERDGTSNFEDLLAKYNLTPAQRYTVDRLLAERRRSGVAVVVLPADIEFARKNPDCGKPAEPWISRRFLAKVACWTVSYFIGDVTGFF